MVAIDSATPGDPGGRNGGLPGNGGVPAGPASGPGPVAAAAGEGRRQRRNGGREVRRSGQWAQRHGARTRRRGWQRRRGPGMSGGSSPGIAAAGTPGVSRRSVRVRRRGGHVRRPEARATDRTGPASGQHTAAGRRAVAGPRRSACTSTGSRAAPRVRDVPGCPPAVSAPAAARRWGTAAVRDRGTGTRAGRRCARTPPDRCRAS